MSQFDSIAWSVLTPRAPGAIAIIAISGDPAQLDLALASLGAPPVAINASGVATLRDPASNRVLDRAVIARFSPHLAHIMAHGGPLIVESISAALHTLHVEPAAVPPALDSIVGLYPEAADPYEARALHALAHAASPLAVDVLLDQPRRWRLADTGRFSSVSADSARRLRHLLTPALVVAVGASNIGKSSLVNALAGRDAAIVADEPGTTRDHVGVHLDLSGLVVRWLDTPGVRDNPGPIESQAIQIALNAATFADLLIVCDDLAPSRSPTSVQLASFLASTHVPTLAVGLRADLAPPDVHASGLRVSIHDRASLDTLATAVRTALLGKALADPGAWAFWD